MEILLGVLRRRFNEIAIIIYNCLGHFYHTIHVILYSSESLCFYFLKNECSILVLLLLLHLISIN